MFFHENGTKQGEETIYTKFSAIKDGKFGTIQHMDKTTQPWYLGCSLVKTTEIDATHLKAVCSCPTCLCNLTFQGEKRKRKHGLMSKNVEESKQNTKHRSNRNACEHTLSCDKMFSEESSFFPSQFVNNLSNLT